jgi:6,7-dimethyl-8-ribityllumazine synthase
MTERYEDIRRPFDLDEAEEPERAPWDRDDDSYAAVPAYAAEDAVEDVKEEEATEPEPEVEREPEPVAEAEPAYVAPVPELKPEPEPEPEPAPEAAAAPVAVDDHAPAELQIPGGYRTLEGEARGEHLAVAIVVSRFNGEITNRLLQRALEELEACGVAKDAVTISVVPGAFELPLAAMALAKTRRYGCVIAIGCVIRGKTRHFEYISSEAASGLQLAALETGTPVSFGVLTLENRKQAELRIDRAADAVHSALEMASMFAQLRATAQH